MDNPMLTGPSALRTSIRLSLQYSFLYSVLSALVFALAYWFTQYEVQDWVLDQMRSDAATLVEIFELGGDEVLVDRVDALAEVSFQNARVYQLLNSDGAIVSGNLSSVFENPLPDYLPAQELPLAGEIHDEVTGYWLRADDVGPYLLIQGAGDHIVLEILEALGMALVAGYLAVVILGLVVGVRIGRHPFVNIFRPHEPDRDKRDGKPWKQQAGQMLKITSDWRGPTRIKEVMHQYQK